MMIPFQCSKSAAAAILISLGLSGKIYCSGERDMPADESTVTLSMMQMQSAAIKSRRSSVELNEGHEETETDMQHDGRHDRKSQGLQEGKDEALTSLQSLVEQWEFKAQKGNLTQTPQQRQQLQDTIDLLANTFQQKLLNESKEDQRTYELKKDQHNACINHKNRRFDNASGDIIAAKNLTEEKKQKHKACRKMQQSLAHLQDDAKIIGDKPWADMVVDHDHSLPSELQSMCPNKDTFKQDLQDYRNAPPANHVSSSCTDDQGRVESQFCAWLGAKTWACQAFDECIDAVDLQGEKDYRKSRESNREALWLTIQKLKCRLNHILAAFPNASHDASHFNQTDNCSNTPASEPWELTLNMTVPDHESCTTVGEKEPSTTDTTKCQEWQNDHYPDLMTDTQNEYASVDDCQQDCLAPPPDLIGIPDHCIDADVSDDCAFYQRHRDACGKYHTDASENCCACGGPPTPAPTLEPTPAPTPVPTLEPTPEPTPVQRYEYVGCFGGNQMSRPIPDVENSIQGVQNCRDGCASQGFEYFGFECPHDNGNEVHCECGNGDAAKSGTSYPQQKCREFNHDSAGHCSGPFIRSGGIGTYNLGAGSIASLYKTQAAD